MSTAVSRRTVVRGAAWSVPVIVVAATVPIAAASIVAASCDTVYFDDFSAGCFPQPVGDGTQNYEYFVRLVNTSGETVVAEPRTVGFQGSGALYELTAYTDDGSGAYTTPFPWFRSHTLQPGQAIPLRIVMNANPPANRVTFAALITMDLLVATSPPVLCKNSSAEVTFTPADSCPTSPPTV
ncbi:hypothetical protein GCM10022200_28500 [Microbacterium awajiense]|uniref:DUF11 domain-containing protein n=1 Tax=Microbacterium awajiense TaxID=415214 RepID=A0ABP7AXJ0_9MICO